MTKKTEAPAEVVDGELVSSSDLPPELTDNPEQETLPPTLALLPKDEQAKAIGKVYLQALSEAQVDFLLQRTPKNKIKMREGRGGLQLAYVEHGYVTERLNLIFGFNWDFDIVDKQILDDEVIVEARLTVRTPGGQTIVKTQFGGADIKRFASGPRSGRPMSIADDYKAASSDALKKCASLLGIGLDLYGKDRLTDAGQGVGIAANDIVPYSPATAADAPRQLRPVQNEAPRAPQGNGVVNKATQPQLNLIYKLAADTGIGAEELTASLKLTKLSELTAARASNVIKRLKEVVEEQRVIQENLAAQEESVEDIPF